MQSPAASVICFSWREIVATGGRVYKNGYNSFANPNHGVRIAKRALDISTVKDQCNKRRRENSILHMGGKLSGFKRLVHGPVPGSMRFSYR